LTVRNSGEAKRSAETGFDFEIDVETWSIERLATDQEAKRKNLDGQGTSVTREVAEVKKRGRTR
jgi:hypothetical protein